MRERCGWPARPAALRRVVGNARLSEANAIAQNLFGSSLVQRGGAGRGAGAGEWNRPPLHHLLDGSVFPRGAVQRQQEHRIVDWKCVEGLLEIGPERGASGLKIDLERPLMAEEIVDGDVV